MFFCQTCIQLKITTGPDDGDNNKGYLEVKSVKNGSKTQIVNYPSSAFPYGSVVYDKCIDFDKIKIRNTQQDGWAGTISMNGLRPICGSGFYGIPAGALLPLRIDVTDDNPGNNPGCRYVVVLCVCVFLRL